MKYLLSLILIIWSCYIYSETFDDVVESPKIYYNPHILSDGWVISGTLNVTREKTKSEVISKHNLIININNDEVINGRLSELVTGELTGNYDEYRIDTVCYSEHRKKHNWIDVRCMILVNDKRIGTLSF